jgi:drug/metabolite transporter (DMT)-like permease
LQRRLKTEKKIIDWLIFFVLSFTWGASFFLMKKGLLHYTSVQVALLRLIFAFLFFTPFLFFIGFEGMIRHFKGLMWVGLFGNFIPAFLFTAAETKISSSLAGILNSTTPLFAWLIGKILFFKEDKNKRLTLTGILLGFLGVIILFFPDLDDFYSGSSDLWVKISGSGMVLLATFFYGLSVQGIHVYLRDVPPVSASAWAMAWMGLGAGLGLIFHLPVPISPAAINESLVYIAILGMAGSGLTLILYNKLIKSAGPVFAASCTYLIPFFSIFWGYLDGENLHIFHFIGLFILMFGLFFLKKGTI